MQRLESIKSENDAAVTDCPELKPVIQWDDFAKLDLCVGTILEARKIPKTKKLLELRIDTGIDQRTIVSGIAETFTPEEVIGKRVTVLVNLKPRTMKGVESQGMILMTENAKGDLVFVAPDELGKLQNGMRIG